MSAKNFTNWLETKVIIIQKQLGDLKKDRGDDECAEIDDLLSQLDGGEPDVFNIEKVLANLIIGKPEEDERQEDEELAELITRTMRKAS